MWNEFRWGVMWCEKKRAHMLLRACGFGRVPSRSIFFFSNGSPNRCVEFLATLGPGLRVAAVNARWRCRSKGVDSLAAAQSERKPWGKTTVCVYYAVSPVPLVWRRKCQPFLRGPVSRWGAARPKPNPCAGASVGAPVFALFFRRRRSCAETRRRFAGRRRWRFVPRADWQPPRSLPFGFVFAPRKRLFKRPTQICTSWFPPCASPLFPETLPGHHLPFHGLWFGLFDLVRFEAPLWLIKSISVFHNSAWFVGIHEPFSLLVTISLMSSLLDWTLRGCLTVFNCQRTLTTSCSD